VARWFSRITLAVAFACAPAAALAQAPVDYRLSFPSPEQGWMQVDVTFTNLPVAPLQIRMSRSSPGRYALHEFARNVYDVRVTDGTGTALTVARPTQSGWDVVDHGAQVRVSYKVSGDSLDGTHLAIDATHAHVNMPAALLWARGLEMRQAVVRFERPRGAAWRVATQLLPGPDAFTFTAPNLQYLMDSPAEFSEFALRTFTVLDGADEATFRIAMHHQGEGADLDGFARDAETIVREARLVFGEFPRFDGGTYTFIGDYLPGARGDAMEHRNSTVLTSGRPLSRPRTWRENVAHEFFHAWNVERIRPKSLEPFNFEDVNVSSDLWLAEGFSDYYAPLILRRAGLMTIDRFAEKMASVINRVTQSPGRAIRTAEEMSQLAPLFDGHAVADRPEDLGRTYLSYYVWGSAIALALDLTLRDRTDGRATLDGFMRALWQRFGSSVAVVPGYVERPYTLDDVRTVLGEVSGDTAFAADFFGQFVQGHDVADYRQLLEGAGLMLRPAGPGVSARQEIVTFEVAGRQLTERQRRFRTAWLERRQAD
jgi:predicted metalloprotease with PDZ domain